MAAIDQIVKINISQQTQAVPQESFSVPLIIGPTATSWGTTDYVHAYFEPSAMLDDGFTTSSPEYIYALELFEQPLTPTEFFVGHRTTAVAQVDTFAVNTITVGHQYKFTLNGIIIAYTAIGGDAQQDILAGLNAAIATAFPTSPPVVAVITGSAGTALDTLTSSQSGVGVSYSAIDSLLTHVALTANNGIDDDLLKIIGKNNTWYGIALCSNADADILQLAALVETLKKMFIGASNDAAIATSSTTDLASQLKAFSYKRTALMFSPLSYNKGIEAAWLGGQLPQTPGSNNWAFQSLVGIAPDVLSDNAVANIIGDPVAGIFAKNGNIFQTVGGKNITQMGTMAGGQYIDITVGIDWLESTLQTNVYQALTSAAKIPYTDKGVGVLLSAVKSAIDQGVVNGLIDGASPITVTAPSVLSVPISQRANRIAPTISFTCRLQGAFNAVIVNGTVTV